ncbi:MULTISPECIES: hypothetical protein [unclassified Ensifer]|nr:MULTISPECIES: hypothetical protein [unclassified Ensifer]
MRYYVVELNQSFARGFSQVESGSLESASGVPLGGAEIQVGQHA